jgi:hypothetical protein
MVFVWSVYVAQVDMATSLSRRRWYITMEIVEEFVFHGCYVDPENRTKYVCDKYCG